MADEIIGSVAVQIEADASDLQGQFDVAVQQATAAGGQIAQGINTGSQGFNSLTTAAGEFTSVMSSLKGLAIASTIEQIGSASLEAFASLEKATIALGALTGSAAQAQSEIAGLRTMAQDDALSFPSLVNANQRFTALGVVAGQIPSALNAAANAAAAMNSSFDQTSNAMERIVSSGTLSARVLVQLGINLQDVASAMGVSSADVVKDFKAITDEGQRLDILTDAMSKLQGTALAVADSLSGSFQRVQNTMLTAFQEIGEAIAPAAKDLADLAQVVIPEVGQAIQGLVAPIDSIFEFGKALADAKDSIGSFVDAASGIPGTFTTIKAAVSDSVTSFASLVPGVDVVTQGFHSLANSIEAYVNEGSNIVTMGNLIVDNLAKQTTAIKVGGQAFQDAMKDSTAFIGAEGEIGTATTKIVESANAAQKAYQDMSAALANNTKDAAGNVVSANDVANAYDNWQKKLQALTNLNPQFADTLAGVTKAFNDQQRVIDTLEQTQAQLLSNENRTADQENILIEVSNKLTAAKQAQAEAHKTATIAIQGEGAAYEGLVTSADAFLKKEADVGQAVVYAKSVLDDLSARNDTSAAGQRALTDAVNQYATAMQKAGGALTDEITITVNGVQVITTLGNAINQVKQSQGDWTSTVVNGVTVLKDHAAAIAGTDQAMQHYNGTIITGQPLIKGYVDDTTRAIGYNREFTGSVNDVGAAIGNTLTPNLNSASSGLSNLSLEAEQADRSMKQLAADAKDAGDEISQAINAMDSGKLGSADATGLGAWALAAQMTGETTFAGSGSAVNSMGQQVSALTELQAANQAAGNALAASLGLTTTATVTNTAAVVSNTTSTASNTAATVASTSAISSAVAPTSSLADSASSLGTALGTTTGAAAQFVDGLGNVYSSYQALVAAIAANPLLGGPAQSVTGTVGSGTSASSTSVVGPDGVTYPSAFALFQAEQANPNILSHQSTGQDLSFVGPQGGNSVSGNVSQSQFLNSLASLFPGSFSMQSAIAQTPGQPFGANASPGGTPVQVVMNYPQFNSQQQSQKTMNDVVTMLRTVPSLKL